MFNFFRTKSEKHDDSAQNTPQIPPVSQEEKSKSDASKLYKASLSWEASRLLQIEKSERKAWMITKLLIICFCLSCLSLVLLLPLKTVEPYIIQVDKSTGRTDILKLANETELPVNEMMNKYWIFKYVQARETYDWRTLNQEYVTVRELSLPNVFDVYASQFGTQKDSLEMTLKDNVRILVTIQSIVINTDSIATVRFIKTVVNNTNGIKEQEKGWTATIGFEYFPTYTAPEERRLVNPLGFKVTSYRVDPEITAGAQL